MAAEVWLRNPDNYIREAVELSCSHLAWDRGYLVKKSLDANRFADLYFPAATDYRMLAVGDQGTAELRRGRTLANPAAVYPTWEYGQEMAVLEEMLAHSVGDDPAACADRRRPPDERPVFGQEHRVVITRLPVAGSGPGRSILRTLAGLQEDHPDVLIHIHGLYSWRAMFGLGFNSTDIDPRTLAQKGKVTLPSGKEVTFERAAQTPQWVRVCGYAPADLAIPRNRCMFNIRSAEWAAAHFRENFNFRAAPGGAVDPDAKVHVPVATVASKSKGDVATVGDKFLCDVCSLEKTCKYFRAGSVCSLPDSEPSGLARLFRSRDSDDIVEGLAALMARQVERLQRGIEDEEILGELDPAVSKAFNDVFANGVKLAKLRNPKLAGGPAVGINITVPGDVLAGARPAELTAAAVRAMEAQGIAREDITPDMLARVLAPAIEAGSTEVTAPVIDIFSGEPGDDSDG